jgi:hypothetical protein
MFFPNGDKLEGEWNDEEIIKAKYIPGQAKNLPRCIMQLFQAHLESMPTRPVSHKELVFISNKWDYFSQAYLPSVRTMCLTFPNDILRWNEN